MIKHNTSEVAIFKTDDYNLFTFIDGNRPLNNGKIKRIIKEIENGNDMLRYYPIQVRVVGENLQILDGQHRFFISSQLQRPVYYILVSEEKSMPDIAKVNSNVEKWKTKDFVNCYVQANNPHYIKMKSFMDEYGFSAGVTVNLLAKGYPGEIDGNTTGLLESFYAGTFEVECYEEACQLGNIVLKFKDFKNCRSRVFVLAVYRIIKANKIPFTDIVAAYQKRPELLKEKATFKDYIYNLEEIVNVGKQNRIIIY